MSEVLDALLKGARDPSLGDVEVVVRPALSATASDALETDGYLLLTPANIGYISGALKHFFDQIYYPVLEATVGRPFAACIHGNLDLAGAMRAIDTITTGLKWRAVAPILELRGEFTSEQSEQCYELGGTAAATLLA
jgi:multimeric flavodoxin WrbA